MNNTEIRSWYHFYKDRVNSEEYEKHFARKYNYLIAMAEVLSLGGLVKEEGIGIGSLAKALVTTMNVNPNRIYGSDICPNMLILCKENINIKIYKEDIRSITKYYADRTNVVVTHGVLEHFNDRTIKNILLCYQDVTTFSIHYVPTEKYITPSFGDERLLSVEYWVDTFKPLYFNTSNEGKDLFLIFKHK